MNEQQKIDRENERHVMRLRNWYAENFANGESDESFLNWVELTLQRVRAKEAANAR